MLPARGLLAGGGGLVSTVWRLVVNFDSGTARAARGRTVVDPAATETAIALSHDELATFERQACELSTAPPTPQTVMTMDALGVLIAVDGDRAVELSPRGPIMARPEADLHRRLAALLPANAAR